MLPRLSFPSALAALAALALARPACALVAPAARGGLAAHRAARPRSAAAAPLRMGAGDFNESGMRKFRWNLNTGREPWGFALNAEVWNGRMAMMGFTICFIQEIVMGKGVLEAYGIGYDEGAVPQPVMR